MTMSNKCCNANFWRISALIVPDRPLHPCNGLHRPLPSLEYLQYCRNFIGLKDRFFPGLIGVCLRNRFLPGCQKLVIGEWHWYCNQLACLIEATCLYRHAATRIPRMDCIWNLCRLLIYSLSRWFTSHSLIQWLNWSHSRLTQSHSVLFTSRCRFSNFGTHSTPSWVLS